MELDQEINYRNENEVPIFLKVLCILTFVGAGLSILTSLWGVVSHENSLNNLKASMNQMNNLDSRLNPFKVDFKSIYEKTKKFGMISNFINLTASILCI